MPWLNMLPHTVGTSGERVSSYYNKHCPLSYYQPASTQCNVGPGVPLSYYQPASTQCNVGPGVPLSYYQPA